jgi:hypothetical protein
MIHVHKNMIHVLFYEVFELSRVLSIIGCFVEQLG